MKFNQLHPRDQLVAIMNRIYHNGMTTLSGGNLSIKDDEGNIWITPSGIDKGNLTPGDMMCVHPDGTIEGPHKPSIELPFHQGIYARRPDLGAVVHAHPPALVSFSTAREIPDTRIIPQANKVCGPVGYAPYAMPGTEQLGENIAETFAQGFDAIILENHGTATGGPDILTAFHRLETLDFCARTLIQARGLGTVNTLTDEQLELFDSRKHLLPEFTPEQPSSREHELREQIVDMVHRACDRYLMIGTEGVASARVDDHSFLITPTGIDRRDIEIDDIVLIRDGKREAGKLPSRSVKLHQAIYTQHADINVVITAQSPHIAAYTISSGIFDTKTIPECYIMLAEMPEIPFTTLYQEPEKVAAALSPRSPVLLIQNDCVLITGQSLLQAFDRLEVAEFSAKSLIDTMRLGGLVPISDADLEALETNFMGG